MKDVRVILQIEDEELYNSVILPAIQERRLSRLLIELLNAYHEDSYVASTTEIAIENKEEDSKNDLLEKLRGIQENVENIRFLNEESKNLTSSGSDIVSAWKESVDIKESQSEKEEPIEEVKMLNSSDYVTREEYDNLLKNQNEILSILRSGSLFDKAVKEVNESNSNVEVQVVEEPEPVEEVNSPEEDGKDIAESLLSGMDFNF